MTNWDKRAVELAQFVAGWSKDPSTKCGAVIMRPDKSICSVGFNGFPRGCSDDPSVYEDRDLKLARVVHAEVNALLWAKESVVGYTMATAQIPNIGPSCDRCTAHVIQAGITRLVYQWSPVPARWMDSIERGLVMYREAGVEVVAL